MDELDAQQDWSELSADAGMVAEDVLKPLFQLLRNSSAHSRHGQIVGDSSAHCPRGSVSADQDAVVTA